MKTKSADQLTMKLNDVVTMISPDDLLPNPWQPKSRSITTPEEAQAGWLSLERSGLIHFPVVRFAKVDGKYEIGDGWQRRNWYLYGWREQKDDKYARVPCIVKELDDRQMADLILDANAQRKDLNPIEWGEFYKKYLEDFKITQEEMGKRFGKSQGEIANTMRLLDLPADIQSSIISHGITESHGRELLRLNRQPEEQQKLVKEIEKNKIPVAELSRRIKSEIYQISKSLDPNGSSWNNPPKFDVKACKDCEHAEKCGREYRCLDTQCWEKKQQEAQSACWEKKQQEAQSAGDEEAKAELKKQGIERLYGSSELNHAQYNQLYPEFIEASPACLTCKHRAAIKHYWDDGFSIVCIDIECFNQKQKQANEARQSERQTKKADFEGRIEKAVENCDDENLTMQSVILLLSDFFDESLPAWFGVGEPEEGEDEHEYDVEAALQKALDELNPHDMAKKLLRGLLLENQSEYGESVLERLETGATRIEPEPEENEPVKDLPCHDCQNNDTCDRSHFTTDGQDGYKCDRKITKQEVKEAATLAAEVLQNTFPKKAKSKKAAKNTAAQREIETIKPAPDAELIAVEEKVSSPEDKDPFAGLNITVAPDDGQHLFKLRRVEVRGNTLKECAVAFLKHYKAYESLPDGEILAALKKLPATPNVALLVGIMESGHLPDGKKE